jgi:hypothetical protein
MPSYTDFTKLLAEDFGELTAKQLWTLTKLAKNVRLRCRNNTAFNNFMNRTFPYAKFETVTKTRPSRYNPSVNESYPGLQITVKNQPAMVEEDGTEDAS